MVGIIFTFIENHLDGKSIICQDGDQFVRWVNTDLNANKIFLWIRSFCWIHGSSFIRSQLQGKTTGCYVDQTKLSSEVQLLVLKLLAYWYIYFFFQKNAPITSYYLWIPFLLSLCVGLVKMPRTLWRNYFEKKLKSIVGDGENKTEIISNFFEMRRNFKKYHIYFGLCEILNLSMVTTLHYKNNTFSTITSGSNIYFGHTCRVKWTIFHLWYRGKEFLIIHWIIIFLGIWICLEKISQCK